MNTMQLIIMENNFKGLLESLGFSKRIAEDMNGFNRLRSDFETKSWEWHCSNWFKKRENGFITVLFSCGLHKGDSNVRWDVPVAALVFKKEIPDYPSERELKTHIIKFLRFLDISIPEKCISYLREKFSFTEREINLVLCKELPVII